ncbi:hypothetical protein P3L51_14885 [Streptomyces sp. PSRA5]|uniref:hypothetical protein n=1 Tax=Streptomyces panacea TaxID=3035064 RepID=UPI00339C2C4D
MRDALDLLSALFSPLGIWLAVTVLMGVAMQLILLGTAAAGIARRTADMVRTVRGRRLAAEDDDGGEWDIVSPPPGQQHQAP